jgi:hypothetical protein
VKPCSDYSGMKMNEARFSETLVSYRNTKPTRLLDLKLCTHFSRVRKIATERRYKRKEGRKEGTKKLLATVFSLWKSEFSSTIAHKGFFIHKMAFVRLF